MMYQFFNDVKGSLMLQSWHIVVESNGPDTQYIYLFSNILWIDSYSILNTNTNY